MRINTELLFTPKLDQKFISAKKYNDSYQKVALDSNSRSTITIGIERENGVIVKKNVTLTSDLILKKETFFFLDRMIKFLLWSNGGHTIYFVGNKELGRIVSSWYQESSVRSFDCHLMSKVYGKKLQVILLDDVQQIPESIMHEKKIGGHLDGHRIGFDLGASDYKVAAIENGNVLYSDEFSWNPVEQSDPEYHYQKIVEGINIAKVKLGRLDAIGGSSAGIIINNQIKVASLFRGVSEKLFNEKVISLFQRLEKEFLVPVDVANDGDVTALAGALSLNKNGVLGIAMGSSLAAGFIDPCGNITGRINELAFAPVDYNFSAAIDEWSQDFGVAVSYFSQQAVNRLSQGFITSLDDYQTLPERLKHVQGLCDTSDERAKNIFETIGTYLGYTIPHYLDFYDFSQILVLGRVTSGSAGQVILENANKVLEKEFPWAYKKVSLHLPSEKLKRVGQAVAAASLPNKVTR